MVERFFRTLKEAASRFHLNFLGGIRRLNIFLKLFQYLYKKSYEFETFSYLHSGGLKLTVPVWGGSVKISFLFKIN